MNTESAFHSKDTKYLGRLLILSFIKQSQAHAKFVERDEKPPN